ncbi:hypothetical protein V1477_001592 [Vespula maculifrons]|uniref:Uncharacterized protein n=1 Tax=Vespula maculifrons TaxID=7453 RepID=A0ABD2CYA3_VESMC
MKNYDKILSSGDAILFVRVLLFEDHTIYIISSCEYFSFPLYADFPPSIAFSMCQGEDKRKNKNCCRAG